MITPALSAEPGLLAQLSTDNLPNWLSWLDSEPGRIVINISGAFVVLIVGWIFATLLSLSVRSLLNRTQIDNRLAEYAFGDAQAGALPIEKWVAQTVYYLVLLFTVVAFLNALNLDAVSEPLNQFLDRIFSYLPQVGGAIAWIIGGWLLATVAKLVLTRGLQSFRLDDRLAETMGDEPGSSPLLLNENLGKIVYWFVLLFFLYFALGTLGLDDQLEPVQNVLTDILEALPQILTAILIGVVGWAIARIVRSIVRNLLASTGIDTFGTRLGMSPTEGRQTLSGTLATVSYAVVLILTAIAALEELNIEAISEPAVAVLDQVLNVPCPGFLRRSPSWSPPTSSVALSRNWLPAC
ncbi:MAG: mechanosensitive ion channel [Spirulinaceae cyanobacterium RM2_2_10]|nr:mechanosensitive ion channel [Spirulinaceae cyanobacterium RM2_2_10]